MRSSRSQTCPPTCPRVLRRCWRTLDLHPIPRRRRALTSRQILHRGTGDVTRLRDIMLRGRWVHLHHIPLEPQSQGYPLHPVATGATLPMLVQLRTGALSHAIRPSPKGSLETRLLGFRDPSTNFRTTTRTDNPLENPPTTKEPTSSWPLLEARTRGPIESARITGMMPKSIGSATDDLLANPRETTARIIVETFDTATTQSKWPLS